MAYLTISIDKQSAGQRELTGPLTIGRSEDCTLCIPSPLLSRKHLELQPTTEGWIAIDPGSKNGTFLDGKRLTQELLKDGAVLTFGNVILEFSTGTFITDEQAEAAIAGAAESASGDLDAEIEVNLGAPLSHDSEAAELFAEEQEAAKLAEQNKLPEMPGLPSQPQPTVLQLNPDPTSQQQPPAPATGPQQKSLWERATVSPESPAKPEKKQPKKADKSPAKSVDVVLGETQQKAASSRPNVPGFAFSFKSLNQKLEQDSRLKYAAIAAVLVLALGGYYAFNTLTSDQPHPHFNAVTAADAKVANDLNR